MIVKNIEFEEVENLEYDTYVNFFTSLPYYMVEALHTGENIGLTSFRKIKIEMDAFILIIEILDPNFRFCTLSINEEVKRSILSVAPEDEEAPFTGKIYNNKGKPSLILYSSGDRPSIYPLASMNIDLFMEEGITHKEYFNGMVISYGDDDEKDRLVTVEERYPIVLKHWPVIKPGENDGEKLMPFKIKVKGEFLKRN